MNFREKHINLTDYYTGQEESRIGISGDFQYNQNS